MFGLERPDTGMLATTTAHHSNQQDKVNSHKVTELRKLRRPACDCILHDGAVRTFDDPSIPHSAPEKPITTWNLGMLKTTSVDQDERIYYGTAPEASNGSAILQ